MVATVQINPAADKEIKRKRSLDIVRIHDSGDFYSPAYRDKWFEVMKLNPGIRFYAYTKSYSLFTGIEIPENFSVVFSEGSKLPLDLTKRHARIFDSLEALNASEYQDASKYDLYATKWFNESGKIGLVFH